MEMGVQNFRKWSLPPPPPPPPIPPYNQELESKYIKDDSRYTNADLKISLYVCFHMKNNTLKSFALLILRILGLFAHEVCKFLEKQANFYLILLFPNVCKQPFGITRVRISQNVKDILI